jgi:NADPH:quinone reductase-like Zn-dependent oxidoreductase
MLKGLTAEYLLRRTYRVKRGDFIVVHAAAGGAGTLINCERARSRYGSVSAIRCATQPRRTATWKLDVPPEPRC